MKTIAAVVIGVFLAGNGWAQEPQAQEKAPESRPGAAKERRMGRAKPIAIEKDREVYGAEVTLKEPTRLADVLKDPKSFEGRKIRVSAVIEGVCQKKGCWMNIADGDARTMVKFVDYSFFVPLDVSGREVVVEGVPKTTVVTEAMRRHYAQDAGKSKEEIEKIKGDETSVMLIVEAVEIGGGPKAAKGGAESRPVDKKP